MTASFNGTKICKPKSFKIIFIPNNNNLFIFKCYKTPKRYFGNSKKKKKLFCFVDGNLMLSIMGAIRKTDKVTSYVGKIASIVLRVNRYVKHFVRYKSASKNTSGFKSRGVAVKKSVKCC